MGMDAHISKAIFMELRFTYFLTIVYDVSIYKYNSQTFVYIDANIYIYRIISISCNIYIWTRVAEDLQSLQHKSYLFLYNPQKHSI